MKVSWLISTSFCFAFSLLAFSVVYKPIFLGYLAASPGVLFLSIPLFFHAMLMCMGRAAWGPFSKDSFILVAYGIFVSVFAASFFDYQKLFFVKAFSLVILSIFWLSPFILSGYIRNNHIFYGVCAFLLFSFIGLFFDLYPNLMPDPLKNIIFSGDYIYNESGRPRGFTAEASQFSGNILRCLTILFIVKNFDKKFSYSSFNVFFIFLLGLVILIQSKGGFASLMIAYAYAFSTTKQLLRLLMVIAIFIVLFLALLVDKIIYDFDNFSSITTRVTLSITVLLGFLYNPFGYGFYGFYPAFSYFGTQVVTMTAGYLVNSAEVMQIFTTMIALSSKSTLLDFLAIFGLFFIVFMYRLLKSVDFGDARSRFAIAFFMTSSLYTSGHDSILAFTGILLLSRYTLRRIH